MKRSSTELRGTKNRIKLAPILLAVLSLAMLFNGASIRPASAGAITQDNPAEEPRPGDSGEGASAGRRVYLPFITTRLSSFRDFGPLLLGAYTRGYLGTQSVIDTELRALDDWAAEVGGERLAMAGTFIDIEDGNPEYNVGVPLERLWQNGYVQFINMTSSRSSKEIAEGALDASIARWARAYKSWTSRGSGRWALIAPMQEMNGEWTPYGLDPANFKLAYRRIQNIFAQEGVPASAVRWVFAPNGYNDPWHPPFEDYYPGDEHVSVIAISAYNFGYCSVALDWPVWGSPQVVFGPYIERIRAMAPDRPIFIAQTATTSHTGANSPNEAAKDQWLYDSYTYLAQQGVKGVLYFNIDKECDWAFFQASGRKFDGYREAISGGSFDYVDPAKLIHEIP